MEWMVKNKLLIDLNFWNRGDDVMKTAFNLKDLINLNSIKEECITNV